MQKCKLVFSIVLIGLLMAGCSQKEIGSVLQKAFNNIQPALEQMDERYTLFEDALSAVDAYLLAPNAERLAASKQSCAESIAKIAELSDAQSTLTDDDRKNMVKVGVNITDYNVPFDSEPYNKSQCVQNLSFILFYLDKEPEENETLRQAVDLTVKNNDVFRKIDYLCINEVFCKFQGEEVDAFKDDFLPKLKSLSADKLPWETDSAVLVAKAEKLMSDAEADIDAYATFVGERYTVVADMDEWYPQLLSNFGYLSDDAERIMGEISSLY